jgi:DNA-binding Lrp family transcriptional regulator
MSTKRVLTSEEISALLKLAPRSNEELRTLTGFSRSGVSKQLEKMELAGLVHRRRKEIHRAAGYQYMWHYGPIKAGSPFVADPDERSFPGSMPKQRIVREYPPINRRDALVEAFFGTARTEAA